MPESTQPECIPTLPVGSDRNRSAAPSPSGNVDTSTSTSELTTRDSPYEPLDQRSKTTAPGPSRSGTSGATAPSCPTVSVISRRESPKTPQSSLLAETDRNGTSQKFFGFPEDLIPTPKTFIAAASHLRGRGRGRVNRGPSEPRPPGIRTKFGRVKTPSPLL